MVTGVVGGGAVVLFFFGEFGETFVEDWGWTAGCWGFAMAAFTGCLLFGSLDGWVVGERFVNVV